MYFFIRLCLEGEKAYVDFLMRKIVKDSRHHSLKVVTERPISKPEFGTWSMAYRKGDDILGFTELISANLKAGSDFSEQELFTLLRPFQF
jgi:hypothetical protein